MKQRVRVSVLPDASFSTADQKAYEREVNRDQDRDNVIQLGIIKRRPKTAKQLELPLPAEPEVTPWFDGALNEPVRAGWYEVNNSVTRRFKELMWWSPSRRAFFDNKPDLSRKGQAGAQASWFLWRGLMKQAETGAA